jgi:glycosyltransferase involved in cell wall biosynthesis
MKNNNHSVELTIILVSYNNPESVRNTLNSILNITNIELQIIIIDSSSGNGVLRIANNFEAQLSVKYFHQKPKGIYAAMNYGISLSAKETLIWFLNPGDVLIDSQVLSELVSNVYKSKAEWGFSQAKVSFESIDHIFPKSFSDLNRKSIALGKVSISHQAIIVKKNVLELIGGFNEKFVIAADLDLLIKLCSLPYYYNSKIMVDIEKGGMSSKHPISTILEHAFIIYTSNCISKYGFVRYLITRFATLSYGTGIKSIAKILNWIYR